MSMSAYYGAQEENVTNKDLKAMTPVHDIKSSKKGGKETEANYIGRTTNLTSKEDNKKYISFAYDLPNMHHLANKRFLKVLSECFENPMFVTPFVKWLKDDTETFHNKLLILDIFDNLLNGNERVLDAIASPASDAYLTLMRLLMTKWAGKTESRYTNEIADWATTLFKTVFENWRP